MSLGYGRPLLFIRRLLGTEANRLKLPALACLGLLVCHAAAQAADTSEDASAREEERAGWSWLEIGGHVDLDSVFTRPEHEDGYTNIGVSEIGLALAAAINDWTTLEAGFLYEHTHLGEREAAVGGEAAFLETATLGFASADGPWSFTVGRQFLPFGVFDTRMISDPLTLEVGETNEIAWNLGWGSGAFQAALFGFGGDDGPGSGGGLAGYGGAVSFSSEREESAVALNLALTSDFGYADNVLSVLADAASGRQSAGRVTGLSAHGSWRYGAVTITGEYVGALESYAAGEMQFAGRGAKPASWMLEAACEFVAGGMDATVAAGYQSTREAIALELPARRLLAVASVALWEPITLGVEWARDSAYPAERGGSGETTTTITVQFSYAF